MRRVHLLIASIFLIASTGCSSPETPVEPKRFGPVPTAAKKTPLEVQRWDGSLSGKFVFDGEPPASEFLTRINEHGGDRKEIKVDTTSDDPKQRPVVAGQIYHFKVERTDGRTVRWFVDENEMHSYADGSPLVGAGHDHFGFNNWNVKVCFDNVRVTPL